MYVSMFTFTSAWNTALILWHVQYWRRHSGDNLFREVSKMRNSFDWMSFQYIPRTVPRCQYFPLNLPKFPISSTWVLPISKNPAGQGGKPVCPARRWILTQAECNQITSINMIAALTFTVIDYIICLWELSNNVYF